MFDPTIDKITEHELSEPLKIAINNVMDSIGYTYIKILKKDEWEGTGPYQQVIELSGITELTNGATGPFTVNMTEDDKRIIAESRIECIDQDNNIIVYSAVNLPTIDIPVYIITGAAVFPPVLQTELEYQNVNAALLGGHKASDYVLKSAILGYINDMMADVPAVQTIPYTLEPSGWVEYNGKYAQTLESEFVTELSVVFVSVDADSDASVKNEYIAAQIAAKQDLGKVVFIAESIPTISIPVNVAILTTKNDPSIITYNGSSFMVYGMYDTLENLIVDHPTGQIGEAYAVGTSELNDVYLWDIGKEEWVNIGKFKGEKGDPGDQGPKGDKGDNFSILGLFATLTELQSFHPTGNSGDIYAVGTEETNELYIWDTDVSEWLSIGGIKGEKGDKGDPGETGPAGQQGIDGRTPLYISAPITFLASNWVKDDANDWWTHPVTNSDIVDGCKVDITFQPEQIKQLITDAVSMMIVNNNGTATAYAFGNCPSTDISGYIEIREVTEQ